MIRSNNRYYHDIILPNQNSVTGIKIVKIRIDGDGIKFAATILKIIMLLMIILCRRYYDTEISLYLSIIVTR